MRKFRKEAFTNVAFLKQITLQTRKSSQIKRWLILFIRMALLATIVVAFSQPYASKNKTLDTKKETVIYLDNSFSMQAKGEKGELLKRAIQDLISHVPQDENIALITNDNMYRFTTIKAMTTDLLQLNYASNQIPYQAALLKAKKYFTKNRKSIKNLVFISDFQQKDMPFKGLNDSLITTHLVQLKPTNTNNAVIDSVYISKRSASSLEITVSLENTGSIIDNLPVSLYHDGNLLSKTALRLEDKAKTVFTIPNNTRIKGEIKIEDTSLQFDNTLFFNINTASKVNVLAISEASDSFLKRMYAEDEFDYKNTRLPQLNYSDIVNQNLIILNELSNIPTSLNTALTSFTTHGGVVILIPPQTIDLPSYNVLLRSYNFQPFQALSNTEKRLTTINYSHPIYRDGVFEKRVTNFQYPKSQSYYPQSIGNTSPVLQFEDGKPFLSENKNLYVFSAPLNKTNSNFQEVNLIVPTFYTISKQSLKLAQLFLTIGKENTFDIATDLQQDAVLTLVNGDKKVIPQQHYFNNKVTITTNETPDTAGIYSIQNKAEIIQNISYNYNRNESNLVYQELSKIEKSTVVSSIEAAFETIKNDNKVNALWKWFVIFALALLIIEMLILKYFK
ncbi:BatA and WFA domain-containing protein [Lacinutrix neustonica]|uniref:BatA and WFA domain-containing protein n=1 Tax=Lacinutrix neustonica TaxID=2980107 RepID=A0A9E8MWY8_9FLAO|nr:BatA and WFA domain-containing protein [Lacinutrix neustonica]WAC02551.1 BatA and WFA domain-containing protein [Lacinutrix neustonica]